METDLKRNRKLRVCVYGGTDLTEVEARLVTAVTERVLEDVPHAVIVTGGFVRHVDAPADRCSTDWAALEGCRNFVDRQAGKRHLKQCFEAWLPASAFERQEEGGVIRMSPGEHDIAARRMGHRSPLGRRLAMVKDVDLVVTFSGKIHTETVLEQALETNTPALPIPIKHTDKDVDEQPDSVRFWRDRKHTVRDWFAMEDEHVAFMDTLTLDSVADDIETTAARLTDILKRAKLASCLVLLKYGGQSDELYHRLIAPTVKDVMNPVRLDEFPGSEPILANLHGAVERAHGVIADVTEIEQSLPLAYEIGYVHAKGMKPLLFTQNPVAPLPVYIRDLNVVHAPSEEKLIQTIRDYLDRMRSSRDAYAMGDEAG